MVHTDSQSQLMELPYNWQWAALTDVLPCPVLLLLLSVTESMFPKAPNTEVRTSAPEYGECP